jgi:hypothetical protein
VERRDVEKIVRGPLWNEQKGRLGVIERDYILEPLAKDAVR